MNWTFELDVTNQHWLGEPDEQSHDGCSHGGVRAVIGGTRVTSDSTDYGISQSALSLLRTLERDHTPSSPVNDGYLLCHGCGYPTHFGCPNFGTDWVVRHEGDVVFLSQPTHVDVGSGVGVGLAVASAVVGLADGWVAGGAVDVQPAATANSRRDSSSHGGRSPP